MRICIIPIVIVAFGFGADVKSQQNQDTGEGFAGRVIYSPVPRVKVIRPTDEGVEVDTTVTIEAQTDNQALDDGASEEGGELPKVVRLGGDRDDEETTSQDASGDAASTEDKPDDQEDRRFKRAPKREPSFKPDEEVAAVPLSTPRTGLKNGARLRQLDKMTGQIQTYDVTVGETVRVARLRVRLDACRSPGDNDTHGTMAFLKIWDSKYDTPDPEFSGWMFAESPALSALDHPRYDLWVINCTTPLGE